MPTSEVREYSFFGLRFVLRYDVKSVGLVVLGRPERPCRPEGFHGAGDRRS